MSLVIALFTAAYAVSVFATGIVPVTIIIRKLMGPTAMPMIWRSLTLQLTERTAVAAVACWVGLAVSGRIRGRLIGTGLLTLGTVMSGALTGAADVVLHRVLLTQLVRASHSSPIFGNALSLAFTAVVAILVTVLLITRSTKLLKSEN